MSISINKEHLEGVVGYSKKDTSFGFYTNGNNPKFIPIADVEKDSIQKK